MNCLASHFTESDITIWINVNMHILRTVFVQSHYNHCYKHNDITTMCIYVYVRICACRIESSTLRGSHKLNECNLYRWVIQWHALPWQFLYQITISKFVTICHVSVTSHTTWYHKHSSRCSCISWIKYPYNGHLIFTPVVT